MQTQQLMAGLLAAVLAKSIAIAIAILGGNSIAILSAILYFKSVLQYFFQYSISSLKQEVKVI